MQRFFFDVRQDGGLTRDVEGEELADMKAAEREAAVVAVHLAKELLNISSNTLAVEVRDERGKSVVRATVRLQIEH
jgi:hypothetical protein